MTEAGSAMTEKEFHVLDDDDHYSESPFLSYVDTALEEWRDGYVRIGLTLRPHHLNRAGVVHGGVLATLLDHAGGFCGLYCTVPGNRRYGMTLSLTSNFLAQSRSGKLTAIGERVTAGKKIYFSKMEIGTDTGVIVATGSSVHRYRSGAENPEGIPAKGRVA
jgi:uncharacterized protein (TIGR00369 family)